MDYSACPGAIRIFSKRASRALMALCLVFMALARIPAQGADLRKKEIKYPDGKLKERYTYYLDDKKHEVRDGLDEEFFNTGTKKGEIPWQAGKENGPVIYYYADGRKSYEANYKDGKKNGYATVWYQNGQKQWQTVFREGLTHGVWREWYADGKKKFEANYSEGKLDGLATWWHENGRLWQERSFQSGNLVKGTVREWDRAGRQTFPASDMGTGGNESVESREPGGSGNVDPMNSGDSPAGN
jgi:antitoxin component YwqK of YwqJK toxin-antitoxin module